jgi:hypothetical protein
MAVQSNPLPVYFPKIIISELMFDAERNWKIELECVEGTYTDIDSIYIVTTTGKAKLEQCVITNNYIYPIFIVQNDCLDTDLTISEAGDSIQIYTYSTAEHAYDSSVDSLDYPLVYGDCATAKIRSPKTNESISVVPFYETLYGDEDNPFAYDHRYYTGLYSISKSPTMAEPNHITGMYGTIEGKVYDKNNRPFFSSMQFYSADRAIEFYLQADGTYSSKAYSCHNYINRLYHNVIPYGRKSFEISPLDFIMEPDSVINMDIHLLDDFSSIEELAIETEIPLKIYPNPVKKHFFYYEVNLPVKAANSFIELTIVNGQKVAQFPVKENKGEIHLPTDIAKGIYMARLFVNNKKISASKLIIH